MLKYLDHVNVRTHQLQALKAFYRDVLGLREGSRPNFSFAGAWMYCGDRPVVHLVEVAESEPVTRPGRHDTLEHFAFSAEALGPFIQRLRRLGVDYRIGKVEDFQLCQVNVWDPDGNHIHIDFPLSEADELEP